MILRHKLSNSSLLFASLLATASFATGSRESDSLALVAIMDANPEHTLTWDVNEPLDTWKNVRLSESGRVASLLQIGGANLTTLPSEIGDLSEVTFLELGSNNLKTLPPEIGKLINLTHLDFPNNEMETLPVELFSLPNISIAYWNDNNFKTLPPEIGNFKVGKFKLGNNPLESLPDEIVNLRVSNFSLENNNLEAENLSDEVFAWLNENAPSWSVGKENEERLKDSLALTDILKANPSNSIPWDTTLALSEWEGVTISKEGRVTKLDISNRVITTVPRSITRFEGLTSLNLSSNEITSFSEGLCAFTALTKLDISNNKIVHLPNAVNQLQLLEELYCDSNNLITIPTSIMNLAPTSGASFSNNHLFAENLDVGVITWLSINDNDWSNGQTVSELTALRANDSLALLKFKAANSESNLNDEWIESTPINRWKGITLDDQSRVSAINLNRYGLNVIPAEIKELDALVKIELSLNGISEIPVEIADLTHLEVLSLAFNQISEIPEEISALTNLKVFSLAQNKITTLPEAITEITPSDSCKLGNNQLDETRLSEPVVLWLDTYDSEWRESQGSVSIIELKSSTIARPFTLVQQGNSLHFSQNLQNGSSVSLYSVDGRKLAKVDVTGSSMQLPSLAKGLYIVRLQSGSINMVKKLSVQ